MLPRLLCQAANAPALIIIMNKGSKPGLAPQDEVRQLTEASLKVQKALQCYQIELTIGEQKLNFKKITLVLGKAHTV